MEKPLFIFFCTDNCVWLDKFNVINAKCLLNYFFPLILISRQNSASIISSYSQDKEKTKWGGISWKVKQLSFICNIQIKHCQGIIICFPFQYHLWTGLQHSLSVFLLTSVLFLESFTCWRPKNETVDGFTTAYILYIQKKRRDLCKDFNRFLKPKY